MEEILASIRRIISEDDAPEGDADVVPSAAPEPAPSPIAAAAPAPEEDEEPDEELELTQRVEPPNETVGDIDAYATSEPKPAAAPEPKPMPKLETVPARNDEESLVSMPSASAAANAFGQLSAAIAMPRQGRTLEDLVRELMTPLLREWLDQNLAAIVEEKVAEEVQRIARRVR